MRQGRVKGVLAVAALACALGGIMFTPASARSVLPAGGSQAEAPAPVPQSEPEEPGVSRTAPWLEAVEPLGDSVPVSSAIVLAFSQPMQRPTVEGSLSIRPRVDGSLTWLDDFTLRYQPIRLAHGGTYDISVAGRSLRGSPLTGRQSWRFTTAAGPPIALAPGPTVIRVPILMYHYIRINTDARDRLGYSLSVTPSDFAAQMQWLAANGYHGVTFHDLYGYLSGANGLPSRPVILTFDDGYADFFTTALPILVKHDFNAVSYVVSGFIGRSGYMTAAQIQAADRAGIEIGSHTVDHADLARLSPDGVRHQLLSSKQTLESLLGHPVLSFCYPSGKFNAYVAAAVEAAGYRDATTTQWGSDRMLAGRYRWGRVRIGGGESLSWFAADVLGAS